MCSRDAADSPSSQSTSTNLLKRVVNGEQEAWTRFVSIYGAFIYARCRRAGVWPQDSADLVQMVLTRVMGAIGRLRRDGPERGLRPWLHTITRNVIRDYFRQHQKEREGLGQPVFAEILNDLPCPLDGDFRSWTSAEDTVVVLRQALECMRKDYEPKTWEAFWRTAVELQPAVDVAVDLGLAPGTVRHAKYKILKRLRDELSELL